MRKILKYSDHACLQKFLFQITLLLTIELYYVGYILRQNSDISQMNDFPQRGKIFKYKNFTNFETQKYELT